MTKEELEKTISAIGKCDFIRYLRNGDDILFYVVGDNEKCGDEEEEDDDCCEGLNGHLFKILFHHVDHVRIQGEEADSYRYLESHFEEKSLRIVLEGSSFLDGKTKLEIEFTFDGYEVLDLGKIEGPDA